MTAVAFDTLKLARTLRDTAKMPQEQAEGIADALAEAMSGAELATKADLREQTQTLRSEIHGVRTELKADIQELRTELHEVRAELKADIQEVRTELQAVDLRHCGRSDALGERIERRTAETHARIESVRTELIRWVLATGVASVLAVIGAMWALLRNLPAAH